MTSKILFAGFGGQGILFSGKFLAYEGLLEERQVSWLPSYGPEMRGGTASCSVILSDTAIGSPIVTTPDILIAMNLPSYDKYESTVEKGGKIFVDSSLVQRSAMRDDVDTYYIPATRLASENGMPTLANMIILGKVIKETAVIPFENVERTLKKVISAKRADMLEVNMKALKLGYDYEG
ncbi:MAG: 2-oxoacid:ferredoxin oxidoreductase subunit gamma [Ruminococcaceae bacterium]|nr:2-oxoacid:ferredoxin oxidoreductase subunit gamma [Oscillospiraceae bacterium]